MLATQQLLQFHVVKHSWADASALVLEHSIPVIHDATLKVGWLWMAWHYPWIWYHRSSIDIYWSLERHTQ